MQRWKHTLWLKETGPREGVGSWGGREAGGGIKKKGVLGPWGGGCWQLAAWLGDLPPPSSFLSFSPCSWLDGEVLQIVSSVFLESPLSNGA